jgi:hypothetical protein
MSDGDKKRGGWKQKLASEMVAYWITVLYLAVFFGMFITYQRLILAQHAISFEEYGISIIKALVLAKVIMLGDLLRIARGFEQRPLIYPTLFRSFAFMLWVLLFVVLESIVRGLLQGKGLVGGFEEFMQRDKYELLARSLVVFFAFIPFFAVRELGRVLGTGKLHELFFRRRVAREADRSTSAGSP